MNRLALGMMLIAMLPALAVAQVVAPSLPSSPNANQMALSEAYQQMQRCMEEAVGKETLQNAQNSMISNMMEMMPQLQRLCGAKQYEEARALLRSVTEAPDAKLTQEASRKCQSHTDAMMALAKKQMPKDQQQVATMDPMQDVSKLDMPSYCKHFEGHDFNALRKSREAQMPASE